MTILSLIEHVRILPVFSLEDCQKWFPDTGRSTLILQLSTYTKRGIFVRLKRGLYLYPQKGIRIDPRIIASRIDPQAVISMETVLQDAGMIPEVPFAVTCVTPGKTARCTNKEAGTFIYRHIKQSLLFGWDVYEAGPYPIKIAQPEKALLDFFWYHRFEKNPEEYLAGLRLTVPENFSQSRLTQYAGLFNNPNITRMVKLLPKTL
jgi:predicted transcriptional regulator of viral defense system